MALTRDEKVAILMAQDIVDIKRNMVYEDYSFICSILQGEGWKQYNLLTKEQINMEFLDRWDDIKDCAETLELAHKLNEKPIDLLRA